MDIDKKIQNSAMWGIFAIATSIILFLLNRVLFGTGNTLNTFPGSGIPFISREIAMILLSISFSAHLWGYMYFDQKFGMRGISISASVAAFLAVIVPIGWVLIDLVSMSDPSFQSQILFLSNPLAWITNIAILILIPSLALFSVFLTLSYRKFGWRAVASIGIAAFPYLFFRPWPLIFLLPPSIYFLFHISAVKKVR